MKKNVLMIIIFTMTYLFADVNINYSNGRPDETISEKKINNINYFKILELNKAFNCTINKDIIYNEVTVKIIDKIITFQLDSSYFTLDKISYNLHYNVELNDGYVYLPSSFIKRTLPILFSENFSEVNNKILFKTEQKNSLDVIVIDPGHGGKDPGAIGFSKKTYEKDIALIISKLVKEKLEKKLNVTAILTRSDDRYVDLHSRTKLANKKGAGLFVSIHCNANNSSKPNGVEVYFLSSAKTNEERAVQHLENSVVYEYEDKESIKNYSDLDLVLADMAQNEHLEASSLLAANLQKKIVRNTDFNNRGVKQAGFYVLKDAFMPAVLIEVGFITNRYEEQKLKRKSYQNKIAESIFLGIKEFIESYKKQ